MSDLASLVSKAVDDALAARDSSPPEKPRRGGAANSTGQCMYCRRKTCAMVTGEGRPCREATQALKLLRDCLLYTSDAADE